MIRNPRLALLVMLVTACSESLAAQSLYREFRWARVPASTLHTPVRHLLDSLNIRPLTDDGVFLAARASQELPSVLLLRALTGSGTGWRQEGFLLFAEGSEPPDLAWSAIASDVLPDTQYTPSATHPYELKACLYLAGPGRVAYYLILPKNNPTATDEAQDTLARRSGIYSWNGRRRRFTYWAPSDSALSKKCRSTPS